MAERMARQEQMGEDIQRRLAGIENTVKEVALAVTSLERSLHEDRGRDAAASRAAEWVKAMLAGTVGAVLTGAGAWIKAHWQ